MLSSVLPRTCVWLLGVALLATLASPSRAADEKVDITGDWAFELELMGMKGTPEFTFKQEGEKVTGKYKGQFGEADLTGTIKKGELEFSFEIQPGAKAVYKGKVDKDTIKGEANYADQASGDFTGKRKKDEKK